MDEGASHPGSQQTASTRACALGRLTSRLHTAPAQAAGARPASPASPARPRRRSRRRPGRRPGLRPPLRLGGPWRSFWEMSSVRDVIPAAGPARPAPPRRLRKRSAAAAEEPKPGGHPGAWGRPHPCRGAPALPLPAGARCSRPHPGEQAGLGAAGDHAGPPAAAHGNPEDPPPGHRCPGPLCGPTPLGPVPAHEGAGETDTVHRPSGWRDLGPGVSGRQLWATSSEQAQRHPDTLRGWGGGVSSKWPQGPDDRGAALGAVPSPCPRTPAGGRPLHQCPRHGSPGSAHP